MRSHSTTGVIRPPVTYTYKVKNAEHLDAFDAFCLALLACALAEKRAHVLVRPVGHRCPDPRAHVPDVTHGLGGDAVLTCKLARGRVAQLAALGGARGEDEDGRVSG